MIEPEQADRIAASINALRPGWQVPGILDTLRKHQHLTPRDAFLMLGVAALTPGARGPAVITTPGPWHDVVSRLDTPKAGDDGWPTPIRCHEHPEQLARDCRACKDRASRTDQHTGAAKVRAAIRAARTKETP